jgi:uncharacterized zinc-type alcohol dehydrogenase-like protein
MKTSSIVALALVFASMSTSYAQNKGERIPAKGFAVQEAGGHFQPYEFTRHAVGDNDIQIDILYAGICHSDLHHVFADWGAEEYPMVPGHEIAGRVVAVGKNVTKFKVGDYAGIGCMIGSCRHCEACEQDLEQYCEEGAVMTYHGIDRFNGNEHTQGGYSNTYVVAEDFAIRVPSNADIEKVAPLMCAGITAYSPLMQAGVKKGDKVGIAGFGGLGHMGVQYAVSLGADVTVFDITEEKREDALRMGATKYVNVNNPEDLKGLDRTFDFILSTIPAKYAPVMYMKMLKLNGQLGIVGLPALRNMPSLTVSELIFQGHRNVFGSQIGGIKETQEMLDYSVEHNIYPEVEVIKARGEEIDKAYQNVLDGKVKFRYVIDMHTME